MTPATCPIVYRGPACYGDERNRAVPVCYEVMQPVKLRIRFPDGRVELRGFGIGERLFAMEPSLYLLVANQEVLLEEVPLQNDSAIVEWPDDFTVKRVWS